MGQSVRTASAAAILLFVGMATEACLAQTSGGNLQLLSIIAPPNTGSAGGVCTYPATSTTSGPFLNSGKLDVAFTDVYAPVLLLASEHFRLTVQGANVRITDLGGAELTSYTVAGDLPLDPLVDNGRGMYPTTLVDASTGDAIRAALGGNVGATRRVVSNVTVFGTTTDGQTIDSNEAAIPVDVCFGCLVTFPAGSSDPSQPQPNCAGSASNVSFQPCAVGQDQPIDCRLCQGNPVCIP